MYDVRVHVLLHFGSRFGEGLLDVGEDAAPHLSFGNHEDRRPFEARLAGVERTGHQHRRLGIETQALHLPVGRESRSHLGQPFGAVAVQELRTRGA